MPAIILYVATAVTMLAAWRRFVQPLRLAVAVILVLLPLCFTGRALSTGRVYAPIDQPYASEPLKDYAADYGIGKLHNGALWDVYTQMIPWQHAARQSLLRGQWPLWNPHQLCGSVLAANMQSSVYDPLHLLALVLPHGQALTFNAALTFFLAGFFTFAFARALDIRDAASLVGAAAYMFSAPLAFFVAWPVGRTWALLPLVLLAVRWVVRRTDVRAGALLTGALVLAVVVGHPETLLHVVSLGAVYGALEVVATRRSRAIGPAVLCGVIALLLTAVVLLPFLEAMPQTSEYETRRDVYARSGLTVAPGAVADRLRVSLFAWYGGQPERGPTTVWDPTNVRVGGVVLALALVSPLLAPRRRVTWLLIGLAVVGVWLGLNAWPLAHALHALPLFDIALNERLIFGGAFGLAMLAAVAVDAWPMASARGRVAAGLVAGGAVALGLGTAVLRPAQVAAGVSPELVTTLALADLLPLAALALLLAAKTPPWVAAPLVLGLVLLQRVVVDGSIYPSLPASAFYPEVPILAHMREAAGGPFRVVGLHYALIPDAAALYGLEDARGYEAMTLSTLVHTFHWWSTPLPVSFNKVSNPSAPFLSFLNVKYAIGSRAAQPDAQWKLVREDRGTRLFENTRVLPRAFVPARVRYEQTPQAVLGAMSQARDFSQTAWILAPDRARQEVANGPGALTIRRDGARFDLDAMMTSDGWVVISEAAWRGWRADLDGRPAPIVAANHAFLGVRVPKGTHHVRIVYRPASFTWGLTISLATTAALLVAAVVGYSTRDHGGRS